jgi:hypothetical protein
MPHCTWWPFHMAHTHEPRHVIALLANASGIVWVTLFPSLTLGKCCLTSQMAVANGFHEIFRFKYFWNLFTLFDKWLTVIIIFLRRKVPGQTGARTCDLRQHRLALNTNALRLMVTFCHPEREAEIAMHADDVRKLLPSISWSTSYRACRKRPQNNLWGMVYSARKKRFKKNNSLSHFIHFQLQILAPYAFKFH